MDDMTLVIEKITEYTLFQALLVIVIGLVIIAIAIRILKSVLKKSKLDPALHRFFVSIARVVGIIIVIVATLDKLNVNTTSFITVLGAAGAAVALALKDSLSNVAGGILILVTKPFGQGDLVQMGDTLGNVQEIDILTTTLKTEDNQLVIVPNGSISTSVIINYDKTDDRRVICAVCVDYDTDVELLKKTADEVAKGSPYAKRDNLCITGILENGSDGMNVNIETWCDPKDYWSAKYYMEESIKLAFDKAGIKMPYQIREVIIKNED